jgi:phosphoribosylaminoimidazole carboxylase PurE protein
VSEIETGTGIGSEVESAGEAEGTAATPTAAEMERLVPGMESTGPLIGIIMGSESDRPVMEKACVELDERALSYEVRVISAHRNPKEVAAYAENAALRGIRVLICGAGMAAALPGVVAAYTDLPVIGVPIASGGLGGMDALLAIAQMPPGVPVGCMAIGGARNAAIFASRILAQRGTSILAGE